ncbi:MAG TPA: GNAT family N-acetyltransferase [Gemmatimonadales bacterium]|nr:GNAT family N-acetyltransferase [Gemmatimonadales bacterium]
MNIELLRADRAEAALANPALAGSWTQLHAACPWATVFQRFEFCRLWYDTFSERYMPVLAIGSEHGVIHGLLPLAQSRADDTLLIAGGDEARYQAWISVPDHGASFIDQALDRLRTAFPRASIAFRCIPPGTPLDWSSRGERWKSLTVAQPVQRRLVSTAAAGAPGGRFLEQGGGLKLLQNLGAVELKVLSEPQELSAIVDQLAVLQDFRLRSVDEAHHARDPLTTLLYERLMRAGLVHAATLTLDGKIVAAHVGILDNDRVMLEKFACSPFFAKHAPGDLYMQLLASELSSRGVKQVDVPPVVGCPESLATQLDHAFAVSVFLPETDNLAVQTGRSITRRVQTALRSFGSASSAMRSRARRLRARLRLLRVTALPGKLVRMVLHRVWRSTEFRLYRMDLRSVQALPNPGLMNRDSLADLLLFMPREGWQLDFWKDSWRKIEDGAHPYTRAEQGRLVHYGWMVEKQATSHLWSVGQDWVPPEGSVIFTTFYTDPRERGRGLYYSSLCQMLHEAQHVPGAKAVFIGVLADNAPSRRVIEKVGFSYEYSFFEKRRPWGVSRWSNAPAAMTQRADTSRA